MGMIKQYIEDAKSAFATATNTKVDDLVQIVSISLDEETFAKSYIIVEGIKNGEECNVRLGVQNLKRITEVLGDDETKWVGHNLRVIALQDYPGLGQKGILWRGEKSSSQQSIASQKGSTNDRTNDIIMAIIKDNPQLSMEDIQKQIEEQKAKAGGLITDTAAAYIIAQNLGTKIEL